jgi:hypothetical protein
MSAAPPYAPLPGHYDEMVDPDGAVRPHWAKLSATLAGFGRHELTRRTQEARRLIRDNGMTFHMHKGRDTQKRPWPLDLVPCVIDGDEWATLERAVAQRARLLDAVLADLYGPQQLVKERTLQAEWLHAHPGMSAAIWCRGPAWSAPRRRMPGSRSTARGSAGWISTPPTTCCHRADTSPWRGVATTKMSARSKE